MSPGLAEMLAHADVKRDYEKRRHYQSSRKQ